VTSLHPPGNSAVDRYPRGHEGRAGHGRRPETPNSPIRGASAALVLDSRERLSDRDPDAPGAAARVVHPTSPASGPRWQRGSTVPAQIKGDAYGRFTERHPADY
jgi:hypothetical protein